MSMCCFVTFSNIFYVQTRTHTHNHIHIVCMILQDAYGYEMSIGHRYLGQQRATLPQDAPGTPPSTPPEEIQEEDEAHEAGHPMTTQFDSILCHSVICVCRKIGHRPNLLVYHLFSN